MEVEEREGIDRAFDVIRNHTVHTKGYVMTALKMIEEYGTSSDKALLETLLDEKSGVVTPKKKSPASASSRKKKTVRK
jgi:hypothetical protein